MITLSQLIEHLIIVKSDIGDLELISPLMFKDKDGVVKVLTLDIETWKK